MDNISNSKRIAKNTVMLYIRMFFTMGIGLFTSREILRILGVDDFGIYNVVGGVVTMMSFLSSALAGATQRFISFELGRNKSDENLKKIFSTTLSVHILLAIIICIIIEIAGIWFLNNKMNILPSRVVAANWVLQFTIFSFLVNVISVPYNALIIAHEKMSTFAYISIVEAALKLLVVYALLLWNDDKLVFYAVLQFVVSLFIRFCYTFYCRRKFSETRFKLIIDVKLFKSIFNFAGWNIVGNIGFSTRDQLSNIILNLFFGTAVNAARGVAGQVNMLISSFANNFSIALNPQITKQYAAGNINESRKYVYAGARLSFFLLTLVSLPVMINLDFLLNLWLDSVPEYTAKFVPFIFFSILLYSLTGTTSCAIQATGDVKKMMIGISLILLLEAPLAYIILKNGGRPYMALYPALLTNALAGIYRFHILKKLVVGYVWKDFIVKVVLRCFGTFILCYLIGFVMKQMLCTSTCLTIVSMIISELLALLVIFFLGLTDSERNLVLKRFLKV